MANSENFHSSRVHIQGMHPQMKPHASRFILVEQKSPTSPLNRPERPTLVESPKESRIDKYNDNGTYCAHRRNFAQIKPKIKKRFLLKRRSSMPAELSKNESWKEFHREESAETFTSLVDIMEKNSKVHSVCSKNVRDASRVGRQILKTSFATRRNSLE